MKELKAKEREEKRVARLAMQESKRVKKERPEFSGPPMGYGPSPRPPIGSEMRMPMYHPGGMPPRHPGEHYSPDQRFGPRLQVNWIDKSILVSFTVFHQWLGPRF